MRYAVIADLHANLEATVAVLERIDALGADRLLCVGDLVGYHVDPNDVVARIAAREAMVIAGNHDRTAVAADVPGYFSDEARRAIEWTRGALTPASRAYLRSLPVSRIVDDTILLVHGAVHPQPNADLRLHRMDAVAESLAVLQRDYPAVRICFFGHVHQQVVHRGSATGVARIEATRVPLDADGRYLVNPGSVGQSRDGDRRAAFCIYDSAAAVVEFHRVDYDFDAPLRKARQAGLMRRPPLPRRVLGALRRRLRRLLGR